METSPTNQVLSKTCLIDAIIKIVTLMGTRIHIAYAVVLVGAGVTGPVVVIKRAHFESGILQATDVTPVCKEVPVRGAIGSFSANKGSDRKS